MEILRINSTKNIYWDTAMEIYQNSFPIYEKRYQDKQIGVIDNDQYHCCVAKEDDQVVGILLYWESDTFLYIEHLAVSPKVKGKAGV